MLPTAASPQALERRRENLALAFQEMLTVCERLRSNRQAVSDAASFRLQIREGLKMAEAEARKQGYNPEDIQLAIFAVVALLDESVLNLRHPVFADWPRRPLQEELFGHHVAGEVFFQNLQKLLARSESMELADLLEVYYLCLLLGFAGRFSMGGRGELKAASDSVSDKIRRIRRIAAELSPSGGLPAEQARGRGTDPWIKGLIIGAAAWLLLVIVLFIGFKLGLGSGVSALESIAGSGRG